MLSATFNLDISATANFNYPTLSELAAYVVDQLQQPEASQRHAVTAKPSSMLASDFQAVARLEEEIAGLVASTLGRQPMRSEPLMEAGLDSLAAVELHQALEHRFGQELPSTIIFDHPTVAALARLIVTLVEPAGPTSFSQSGTQRGAARQQEDGPRKPVTHVLATACRFPSSAHGVDGFWEAAMHGSDASQLVPLARWDLDLFYEPRVAPGKMYMRFGMFVHALDSFDRQVPCVPCKCHGVDSAFMLTCTHVAFCSCLNFLCWKHCPLIHSNEYCWRNPTLRCPATMRARTLQPRQQQANVTKHKCSDSFSCNLLCAGTLVQESTWDACTLSTRICSWKLGWQ